MSKSGALLIRIVTSIQFVLSIFLVLSAIAVAQAASWIKIEPEEGALSGSVQAYGDANASGGSAVQFLSGESTSGCWLASAVFCEDFEAGIASNRLRSGDLNSQKISFSRMTGTPYDNLQSDTNWIRRADIPACRSGSVTNPFPNNDVLICDPSSSINSHYGLVAAASQNYGDTWGRVTQPFDIAGRTGKIAFDASLYVANGLYGNAEIGFIDEPTNSPSIIDENGNGAPPRNGILFGFNQFCQGTASASARPKVRVFSNYAEVRVADMEGMDDFCPSDRAALTQSYKLNRVEIRLSQNHVEVWASDFSANGTSFGALKKIYSANISLNFSRGYMLFGSHNHATNKYGLILSHNVLWDNVAFDGPAIAAGKNYQVPDNTQLSGDGMNIGYGVKNISETLMAPLQVSGVTTSGVTSAKLSYAFYMEIFFNQNLPNWRMNYRLNGGTWHQHAMPTAMASSFEPRQARRYHFVVEINPAELVNGTNTIQFAGQDLNNGYQSFIANVDLMTN